jgi:DNA-binding XRE family transcriptional regulator
MTQQELADVAGVDLKTIYNLESGARWPIARTRAAVASSLGWDADALDLLASGAVPPMSVRNAPPGPRHPEPQADDPALDSFIASVHRDLAKAVAKYGPNFTPEQAFTAPHEAAAWSDPDHRMPDDDDRVRLIAQMRLFARKYAERDPECRVV